jgi:hypothetical protein
LCEGLDKKVLFKEWGRECPGCARRRADEVRVEREGRRRGASILDWDMGRAAGWEREGWEGRNRDVEERRRAWDDRGGGGGLRGRSRWGDGY